MSFSIIAAIGKNRELGKKGGLCFQLHDDMKYFRETTKGHTVLMGSKTFFSLPKMLPGRKHIVISSRLTEKDLPDGVELFHSITDVVEKYKDSEEEIFVIGGGMVYAEMLKYSDKIYLTEVEAEDKDADTFFQPFNKDDYIRTEVGTCTENGINFTFVVYSKKEEL
jgi:dihydrofolate reductase